jgi:hypothetical protein
MGLRALILAFVLAALGSSGRASAEDDPACAQYKEPMAYNACLARHGPKANDIGRYSRRTGADHSARDPAQDVEFGMRPKTGRHWQGAQRAHGRVHMEFLVK